MLFGVQDTCFRQPSFDILAFRIYPILAQIPNDTSMLIFGLFYIISWDGSYIYFGSLDRLKNLIK